MKGKTIIITGAAMGLGYAAAKELASRGANLALVDYNKESLEVAKVVAFLLSEDSSYLSGQTIAIDGGQSNIYGNV